MERNRSTADVINERKDAADDPIKSYSYLLVCVAVLILAIFFSFAMMEKTGEVPVVQLQTRINPNDAPAASLVRLPQIGITRAEKIIAYRQTNSGEGPVFICPDDLQKVKGIGPAIAGQLTDHLRFE